MKEDDKITNKFTPAARELLQSSPDRLFLIRVHFPDRIFSNMDLCKKALNPSDAHLVFSYSFIGLEEKPIEEKYPSGSFVHSATVGVYATWKSAKKIAALNKVAHITLTTRNSFSDQQRGKDGEYPYRMEPFRFSAGPLQGQEVLVSKELKL